jgi:hypothetical protein
MSDSVRRKVKFVKPDDQTYPSKTVGKASKVNRSWLSHTGTVAATKRGKWAAPDFSMQSMKFIGHGSGFSTDRPSHRYALRLTEAVPRPLQHQKQQSVSQAVRRRPKLVVSNGAGPEHSFPMSGRHTHRAMTALDAAKGGSHHIAMAVHANQKPVSYPQSTKIVNGCIQPCRVVGAVSFS